MCEVPQESEIKVLLSEREAEALRMRLGYPTKTVRQVSEFYDTSDDLLARSGVALRIREETEGPSGSPPRIVLTVKEAGVRAGALMVRPETESRLEPALLEELRSGRRSVAELDLPPVRRLRELVGELSGLKLELFGRLENLREVYDYAGEEIRLELLLDRTTYPDGSVEYELETELAQSDAGLGARALRRLFSELAIEWRPSPEGKYVRLRRKLGRRVGTQ